jgi:hypothetical protein
VGIIKRYVFTTKQAIKTYPIEVSLIFFSKETAKKAPVNRNGIQ